MSRRPVLHAVVIAAAAACPIIAVPIAAFAQGAAPSSTSAIGQPDWPRAYRVGNDTLQLYPPTAQSYAGDQVSGTMAFALGPTSGAPVYGRASFSATARTDAAAGTVRLSRIRLSDLDIPLAPDRASAVRQMLAQKLRDQAVSLPASLVAADVARASAPPPVVNTTPPAIAFADGPSLLVPVAGPPDWRAVPGGTGIQRVLNTQALLLKDVDQVLHLKAAGLWYEATTLSGPWIPTPEVPPDVQAAATAAEAQQPTDPLLPPSGQPPVNPPAILVATTPTELIQTDGPPKIGPVAGTQLTTWDNADHAVFVTPGTGALYILISGRWFTAASTSGPWTYVAPDALPADFARIAPTDPKANVLISVAGTPQARNAAIAATLPQTAAVPLSATANVSYEGAPHFVPISGTQLSYAQNTATPVIRVAPDQLYTVSNGVWFSAPGPTGPWRVATSVPDAIYSIPAASPVHYVTGVRVYGTSGSSVITGYTPAYMGVLPGPGGTVVYGSGYVTPGYVGTRWIAPPVTYGVGAGFAAGPRGFGYGFSPGWSWGGGAGPGWGPYAGATPYGRGWGFADVGAANIYGRWGEGVAVGGGWGGVGFGVSAWSHGAWGGVGVSIGAGGIGFGYGGFSAYGGRYMSQNVNIHNTYNNNHTTIINNDNHNTYNNNHNNDNNNDNNRNSNNRNSDNNNNNNGRNRPDPRNPSGSNPGGDGNRGQNGDHGNIGPDGRPDTHQGPGPAEPNGSGSQNRGGTPQGPGPARPSQGGASGQPDTHQGPGPAEPNGSGSQNRGGTPQGPGPARPSQGGASGQPDTHQGPGPAEPNGSGSQNRGGTPQGPGPARPSQGGASGQPDTHQGPGPAEPNGSGSQNRGGTPQGPGPARPSQGGASGQPDAHQGPGPAEPNGSGSQNKSETPQGPGPARQPQSGGGGKSDASQGLSPSEQKGSTSRTGTPGELGPQTPSENKNSEKQTRPASQDDAARNARSADRPSDAATSGDRGRGRDEAGTDRSGADARRDGEDRERDNRSGEDRNRDDRRDDSARRSEDRGDHSAHREEGHHEEHREEHHEDEHHGDHDRR